MIKEITGGVCAAQGFRAAGIHCGIQPDGSPEKNDLALILSERECSAAAVYTLNRVKAAPIYVTMDHLEKGVAWGIVANSGNANACCPMSHENAEAMCLFAAQATGREAEDFAVASSGIIGQTINIQAVQTGVPKAAAALSREGSGGAATAIMTTDSVPKEVAVSLTLGGKEVKIGAIAKGSGMIHPNMCTMLAFVTTDAVISKELLTKAVKEDVTDTFNMISVDGDTSTNDTLLVMANGMAHNEEIKEGTPEYEAFKEGLHYVNESLAKMMAGDGEGATALFEVKVTGAATKEQARKLSRSVVGSSLCKAAIYGHDANWGRFLCALGYAGVDFDPEKVELFFESRAGRIQVYKDGMTADYSEEEAEKILSEPEVTVLADMKMGSETATAWGCDLTYDYVKINADYRS